jgi:hypothetical protein
MKEQQKIKILLGIRAVVKSIIIFLSFFLHTPGRVIGMIYGHSISKHSTAKHRLHCCLVPSIGSGPEFLSCTSKSAPTGNL